MTDPHQTWLCTGISWHGGAPSLTLIGPEGHELSRRLTHGDAIGFRLTGFRRCVGIWRDNTRRCPFGAPIDPDATDAQCAACAGADPGRALARDLVRDRRTFRLYLAWFGPGLVKVGICAAERGNTRLLEQGALAFTWLAHGDHQLVRTAEQAVADSGVAVERQRRASKLPAWFSLGPPADYIAELRSAHAKAQAVSGWPDHLSREPFLPADHFEAFGLDAAPPPLSDVVAVGIGSVVAGRVAAVVGGELILDTPDGAVVVSGKRLAGWPVFPTTEPSTGYDTSPLNGSIHDDQPSLF